MRWKRDLQRTYSTVFFSQANVFCIILFYLAFAIPFYLSFGTENFWMKQMTEVYNVQNSFSGNYVAEIILSNGTTVHVSNLPGVSLTDNTFILELQGTTNSNKNIIKGSISKASTASATDIITGIQLYLFFDSQIQTLGKSFSSTLRTNIDFTKGNSAKMIGSLGLNQKQPIRLFSSSSYLSQPPYIQNKAYLTDYSSIIKNVAKNHQLSGDLSTLHSPSDSINFKFTLFNRGINEIIYYPSFTQTLRNNFSQYFSLLIVTLFLTHQFLNYLASHKIFSLSIQQKQFKLLPQNKK